MNTTQQLSGSTQQGSEHFNQGAPYRGPDPRQKSPFYAGLLSLLPGLGQVYVGYYKKGFGNIIVAATILSMLTGSESYQPYITGDIFFLIFFLLYNVIDAVRRAALYNLTLEGIEQIDLPDDLSISVLGGSYLGGAALLVFGIIALSYTAFGLSLDWLNEWWPLLPIGFGGYLVYKAWLDAQVKPTTEQ